MKSKVMVVSGILLAAAIAVVTGYVSAEGNQGPGPETKVIFLHGVETRLLNGDPMRMDKIGPNRTLTGTNVLPILLSEGWRVKEIRISEVLAGDQVPSGYVVIEK